MNLDDNSLMIIDDDDLFRNRLILPMKRKGYEAYGASSVSKAKLLVDLSAPHLYGY
jgi:Response regulator consisting of a CheY-like receiver domain and a Fis-type HTH domain